MRLSGRLSAMRRIAGRMPMPVGFDQDLAAEISQPRFPV